MCNPSARIIHTPPAPPPFQPQPVEVALGENGGTATLMTVEGGGFTLNGEAFEGGAENPVEGEGGRMYALTLADGAWTATFVPMEVTVALGASEESVTLMTTEAGGYTMGGMPVESGGTATTSAGANYTLTMAEDGTWSAMFAPMTQTVTLGASGMSVELVSDEAGMWAIGDAPLAGDGGDTYMSGDLTYALAMDDDGTWTATFVPMTQTVKLGALDETVTLMSTESGAWAMGANAVEDGYMTTAANGNRYMLTMAAGEWTAAFQPMSVQVMLGGSGEFATLMTAEDRTYTMDGRAVASGATAMNSRGESYALTLADGAWTATHMPSMQTVDLGASGMSVMLATNEAGVWTLEGDAVGDDDVTVEGGDNAATGAANTYVLTLADDGTWGAEYQPASMEIGGTDADGSGPGTAPLSARAREDGSGYDVGETMSLDAEGMGEITDPDGGMFRVRMDDDGRLTGMRYDMDMANDAMSVDAKGTNDAPALSPNNRKTDFDEKNTMLNALGASFSIGELLGGGPATVTGANVVAKARAEMVKIRDRVAQLVALRADDGITDTLFTPQVEAQWARADTQIRSIFGGTQSLERTTSASRVVDAFDRIVDALSSEDAFAAATLANGPDKLQGFHDRTASEASAAFNRLEHTATARLGSLGSTRFGAAVFNQLGNNRAKGGFGGAEKAQAFAWSTMDNVRRVTDVTAVGAATYQGRTLAADKTGNLYSGSIDILVNLTFMTVDGQIGSFGRADTQEPWSQGLGGEVEYIDLPQATLGRRGDWSGRASSAKPGLLRYAPRAGGFADLPLETGVTFAGQLLGRGEASGSEAIGTWTVAVGTTTLAGGFGAARGDDRAGRGPAVAGDLAKIGKQGSAWARMEAGPAALPAIMDIAADADADPPVVGVDVEDDEVRPAIVASTVINTANAKFKYVPQPMDDPAAAEYVVGDYTPNRADVLDTQDFEEPKGNWVEDARDEIAKKLRQLRLIIATDNADASAGDRKFANDQRQRLYTEIQNEIRTVFGPDSTDGDGDPLHTGVLRKDDMITDDAWTAHVDYPVTGSGVAQDASVLNEIEDVLAAFADGDAFAAAFDSGGLFESQKGNAATRFGDGYPTPAAIFGRARGKLRMATDATDVTRFGGWNHQVSDFAAAALAAQNYDRGGRGQEFGSFAYSPLDPVAEYATGSRLYPAQTADVSATYAGRTSAAQGDTFYAGNVEAKVFWNANDVEMSDVRLTITDLEDTVNGDPLEFGYARAGSTPAGTVAVESLEWEADVTNDGVVKFNSSADVTVKVDTLSGDPVYRPVYGSTERVRGVGSVRYYGGNSGISQEVRLMVTANALGAGSPDQDGPYWVLRAGPADESDAFGALTFWGIGTGRQAITRPADLDTSGTAFDEAKAAFEAGQESLAYPTHVVSSFSIETSGGASRNEAFILLFKDGSTFHYHGWTDHNADFIGSATEAASAYRSAHFEGNPLLSANDNALLFTGYGQSFTKPFLTKDGDDPATDIGVGAPTGGAAALAARWFRDNPQYVNVPMDDATARNSKLEGMFVGQDQGGPLGIIGTWELTGGAFGIGDSTQDVRGAFGADIQP